MRVMGRQTGFNGNDDRIDHYGIRLHVFRYGVYIPNSEQGKGSAPILDNQHMAYNASPVVGDLQFNFFAFVCSVSVTIRISLRLDHVSGILGGIFSYLRGGSFKIRAEEQEISVAPQLRLNTATTVKRSGCPCDHKKPVALPARVAAAISLSTRNGTMLR